ncbi:5-formyltetrahydrofolate cyclo-ligase [Candidatus Pelagibacter sp.]|nr:5-formyltetrahydrofolate cyclo-ligase [Candidatus Pelagibacter sp.]
MKTETEKEKKLIFALSRLKSLNLKNPILMTNLENLNAQKNQLEIEKNQIEKKYLDLKSEHKVLNQKLDNISKQKIDEKKKETEFSEKIDELNQETDTLLEEIDKWQM